MTDILDDSYESDLTEEEHERLILMSEHAIAPPLSPAAQAVLDAYEKSNDCYREEWGQLAAALRVISEFVRMDQPIGDTDADAGVFTAHQFIHGYIAGIADELEAQ